MKYKVTIQITRYFEKRLAIYARDMAEAENMAIDTEAKRPGVFDVKVLEVKEDKDDLET